MLTRRQAIKLARFSEALVCTEVSDVAQLISIYAELGMYDMDIFIDKSLIPKIKKALDKRGFYYRVNNYEALEHECSLYVSWMSNL